MEVSGLSCLTQLEVLTCTQLTALPDLSSFTGLQVLSIASDEAPYFRHEVAALPSLRGLPLQRLSLIGNDFQRTTRHVQPQSSAALGG